MPNVLILLTLPKDVRNTYASRLGQKFPELTIDVVDHYSKAPPFMAAADVLLTFGPMMKDEVLHNAPRLKWVQALGTGVDGVIDQPSLRPDVIITNIRGIHGAPVSEAALMAMLALSRRFADSVRHQDRRSWTRWPPKLLDGKTVGIFGIGLIAAGHHGGGRGDRAQRVELAERTRSRHGLKRVRQYGGDLSLVCTREHILKILDITGLVKVLKVYDSVEAASTAEGAEGNEEGKD